MQWKFPREERADLLRAYFVQFGIIIFPIFVYQIWIFRKSFNQIPFRTFVMGLYGGLSAILCQLLPVSIFGQTENFQCIPVILAILYGKRRAGILSIALLAGYQIITKQPNLVVNIFAILVYSAIPMVLCVRFERYDRRRRFFAALLLSLVTLLVELLFLVVYFLVTFGNDGLTQLAHYCNMLGVACVVQLALMSAAFFLLENIIENGRMRNRYESLIKYNPLGICAFDLDNRFIAVNSAYEAITGYKESELLGSSRLDVWFAEDHEFAEELSDHVLAGVIKKDFESVIRHKDGHKVVIRSTLVPMVEGEHQVGYFGMVTDITDSKLAEEALRNSDKLSAIGQLAAGIAHEIRNPLTVLIGFLQLIPTTKDPHRFIEIMKDELTRIELIVSELLVLAKPHDVQFSLRDIRQKLIDVLHLLNAQAAMKSINIETQFDENLPSVECEANQLKQVFLNLIKNAIEATNSGGRVTIHLQALNDDQIMVRISDTGPGIPKHILSQMGEPFFTTKPTGTGLGLMMCKKIITNHYGKLEIASEVGSGTTVSVVLPFRQPDRSETI